MKYFVTPRIESEFYDAYHATKNGQAIIDFLNKNYPNMRETHLDNLMHFAFRLRAEQRDDGEGNVFIFCMAWEAWTKFASGKSDWSLIGSNFPRILLNSIPEGMSKQSAFSFLEKAGQEVQKRISFDYALPQTWLNEFEKKSGIDYYTILGTTVWVYSGPFQDFDYSNTIPVTRQEGPVSCCEEVQLKLEEFYYKGE